MNAPVILNIHVGHGAARAAARGKIVDFVITIRAALFDWRGRCLKLLVPVGVHISATRVSDIHFVNVLYSSDSYLQVMRSRKPAYELAEVDLVVRPSGDIEERRLSARRVGVRRIGIRQIGGKERGSGRVGLILDCHTANRGNSPSAIVIPKTTALKRDHGCR